MPETKEAPERIWMHYNRLGYWFSVADECKEDGDIEYVPKAAIDAAVEQARRDCLTIAQGCFDYGGGYRSDDEKLEIYHHGIQTVVNALTSFIENGLKDTQVASLYRTGREAAAKEGR